MGRVHFMLCTDLTNPNVQYGRALSSLS